MYGHQIENYHPSAAHQEQRGEALPGREVAENLGRQILRAALFGKFNMGFGIFSLFHAVIVVLCWRSESVLPERYSTLFGVEILPYYASGAANEYGFAPTFAMAVVTFLCDLVLFCGEFTAGYSLAGSGGLEPGITDFSEEVACNPLCMKETDGCCLNACFKDAPVLKQLKRWLVACCFATVLGWCSVVFNRANQDTVFFVFNSFRFAVFLFLNIYQMVHFDRMDELWERIQPSRAQLGFTSVYGAPTHHGHGSMTPAQAHGIAYAQEHHHGSGHGAAYGGHPHGGPPQQHQMHGGDQLQRADNRNNLRGDEYKDENWARAHPHQAYLQQKQAEHEQQQQAGGPGQPGGQAPHGAQHQHAHQQFQHSHDGGGAESPSLFFGQGASGHQQFQQAPQGLTEANYGKDHYNNPQNPHAGEYQVQYQDGRTSTRRENVAGGVDF